MTKKQWLEKFFVTRETLGRIEKELLEATEHIYTEKFANKIASKKNWRERILNDLIAYVLIAHHESYVLIAHHESGDGK